MASPAITFNDIRIIICTQGYSLDYQYVLREIGFCFNNQSGVIPFNCKINLKELDVKNQRSLFYLEDEVHAIKSKKTIDLGLSQSDFKSVLRTLYHMSKYQPKDAKYIGIVRDQYIFGLLHRAGLGHLVVDLDNLSIFNAENKCPSNVDLRIAMKNNNKYNCCYLHDQLRINDMPICAKAKAEYVHDICEGQTINS